MAASSLLAGVGRVAGGVADLLMPPLCVSCKAPVAAAGLHCPACWAALAPPPGARCATCSDLLPENWAAEAQCLACVQEPPPFAAARAPFLYADVARETVLAFKYGAEHLAPLMARQMLTAAHGLGPDGRLADMLLVPVPLNRWRLFRRGFNQSLLLARALARLTGAELAIDLLRRPRGGRSTQGLGRQARAQAMRGAFAVPAPVRERLRGRHVLLIDDVMTSGATAAACARVLRRHGAARVEVLTYARVAAERPSNYLIPATMRGHHAED